MCAATMMKALSRQRMSDGMARYQGSRMRMRVSSARAIMAASPPAESNRSGRKKVSGDQAEGACDLEDTGEDAEVGEAIVSKLGDGPAGDEAADAVPRKEQDGENLRDFLKDQHCSLMLYVRVAAERRHTTEV